MRDEQEIRLEAAASLFDAAADEFDLAGAHARMAAERFRAGDVPRAQRAKEQAAKPIAGLNYEDKDFKVAGRALQKALVRLQLASKETRR